MTLVGHDTGRTLQRQLACAVLPLALHDGWLCDSAGTRASASMQMPKTVAVITTTGWWNQTGGERPNSGQNRVHD